VKDWHDLFMALQNIHPWTYESETTRRCQVCGRLEQIDSMSLYMLDFNNGFWIVLDKGDRLKHMN
jgi:hypothetical protein